MKKNIGKGDRLFRLLLGIVLFIYGIWEDNLLACILSAALFFEVFMCWCPLYQIIGRNTCPTSTKEGPEAPKKRNLFM